MSFSTPLALLLLLLIPYFFWLGRPRRLRSRGRERVSLALRLLILLLLVFSLAGAQMVRAADELAVVFLVDASDSISPAQAEESERLVRQAIEGMTPADKAAVIVFGANALVERPMSGLAELAPVTSVPQTLHSDIGEAIRLALALFPAGSARRMVLISDGAATQGDPLEAARLAAAAGIPIDIVPLSRPQGDVEVMLTEVDAPARVGLGERFTIEVTAESSANLPARLQVLAAGRLVYDQAVQLRAGVNNFPIQLEATVQEFARYQVQISPQQDTYYQNNQLAAFTDITGPPRILLVAPDGTVDDNGNTVPDESPQLRLALEATGLEVERVTPAELPSSLSRLSNYASVVLVNVNAKNLSPRKMTALQSYVRDLGGGLVVVGGPGSYGMGGYYRTPLEETLPVDMQIKDQERFPSVSMALVIDRSGSMSVQEGGAAKIQLAAEGAVRVVELLNDFDEITVIPVDTQPDNPIGPAPAAERGQIIEQIRQIGSGGGGIYVRTGLEAAAEALAQSTNQIKHIIVLADGADSEQKEGVPELIQALAAEGITVSMVSIGDGPDVPWLQRMAELGGGRFHFTDRAANLPQIFTQETTSIQRSYLVEERFFPALGDTAFARRHAIFRAMESAGITLVPPLYGYVGTSPKATSQVILESHLGDPLLAAWEYGLGRSVAWTSDATGRWGTDWVLWDGFPVFWSNLVRWSVSQGQQRNVETAVTLRDDQARLTVDALGSDGSYLNNLTVAANVVDPDGQVTGLELQQVAPGRYEGDFALTTDGAFLFRVTGSAAGQAAAADQAAAIGQTAGWVLAYSPEYRLLTANPQLLNQIAEMTGGRDLPKLATESAAAPAEVSPFGVGGANLVFEHNLPSNATRRPIWPWLLLAALLLLPLDVAVRRLVINRRDVNRAWAATFGRWRPAAAPVAERSEQVSRLFHAKQRAGTAPGESEPVLEPTIVDATAPAGEDEPAEAGAGRPERKEDGLSEPQRVEREDRPPAEATGSLASRLLEKRRQQQEDSEKTDG